MADISPGRELKDLKIITAVDISGSTAGHTLRTEIEAVKSISAFIETPTDDSLTVLPWDSHAHHPIRLPKGRDALSYLKANAGTRPSCLYEDPNYLDALRSSQLWILLTDGMIHQAEIQDFATRTTELCLHGIPSIVILFAYTSSATPANTDTSVGLAIYARSPDSLFLLHDLGSGSLYIISAKGSFKCLLKGKQQPDITEDATWKDLPTMEYKDLPSITVSPPRKLTPDEIALQDGVVVKLEDLFEGKVSADVEEQISRNPASMSALVQTEMSSTGRETPRLSEWIGKQQTPLPTMPKTVLGKGPEAKIILERLLKRMKEGETDARLHEDRTSLRTNHEASWAKHIATLNQHEQAVRAINQSNSGMRKVSRHVEAMRMRPSVRAEDTLSPAILTVSLSPTIYSINKESDQPLELRPRKRAKHDNDGATLTDTPPKLNDCFLPGFKVADVGSGFAGRCSICHRESVLALIVSVEPTIKAIRPKVLTFFTEIKGDIPFYAKICCDACASYIVKSEDTLLSGPVFGSVVLNSVNKNVVLWLETLNGAFSGHKVDLPLKEWVLYFSWLDDYLELEKREDRSFEDAIRWIKMQFEEIVKEEAEDGDSEFTFVDRP